MFLTLKKEQEEEEGSNGIEDTVNKRICCRTIKS